VDLTGQARDESPQRDLREFSLRCHRFNYTLHIFIAGIKTFIYFRYVYGNGCQMFLLACLPYIRQYTVSGRRLIKMGVSYRIKPKLLQIKSRQCPRCALKHVPDGSWRTMQAYSDELDPLMPGSTQGRTVQLTVANQPCPKHAAPASTVLSASILHTLTQTIRVNNVCRICGQFYSVFDDCFRPNSSLPFSQRQQSTSNVYL